MVKKERYNPRSHKIFEAFYLNKNGSIKEHKSARGGDLYTHKSIGGIYRKNGKPLNIPKNQNRDIIDFTEEEFKAFIKDGTAIRYRYNVIWKHIKGTQSIDEIRMLIGDYKHEQKDLDKDKKDHQEYIRELRTAIKMAGDWYHVLKYREETEGKYGFGAEPPINMVDEEDQDEYENPEEGSAIDEEISDEAKEILDKMTFQPRLQLKEKTGKKIPKEERDVYLRDLTEHIERKVGEYRDDKYKYHKHVDPRVRDIVDREAQNEWLILHTKPELRLIYKSWRKGYAKDKR